MPADLNRKRMERGIDIASEPLSQHQPRSSGKFVVRNILDPGWQSIQQFAGQKLWRNLISEKAQQKKESETVAPPAVEVRRAENAWKPVRRVGAAMSDEEKQEEKIRKTIRSLLNKITPTSYDTLKEEFFALGIGVDGVAQKIAVELIFDKAVEEPKFCSMYTQLCKAQAERSKRVRGSFYEVLVSKAQKTFEGASAFEVSKAEIKAQLKDEVDEKKKADLEERMELISSKERRYVLGNIKYALMLLFFNHSSFQVHFSLVHRRIYC